MALLKRKNMPIPNESADEFVELSGIHDISDNFFQDLPDDPITKAHTSVKTYRNHPLKFIKHELGISIDDWKSDYPPKTWKQGIHPLPLWSKQREIITSLVKYRKVAVKSGHGLGKSFSSAVAALYLHYAWKALGVTTAPTFRQVRRVLWGEIHNLYHNAPRKLGGKLYQTSLESGDKWFVEGFSVRDPASAITGFHEESIFVIVDEAGGVAQEVFDSMEGILTSLNSFVLLIGNPLDSASAFADAFKEGSDYHKITMSCYDSPNVKHQKNIYSKLCAADWPEKMKKKWGVDSNLFRVRVLGEFPEEGKDTLIPIKYIDMARDAMPEYRETTKEETLVSFGVDVARFGTDSTVIGARWMNQVGIQRFQILDRTEKQRTDQTTDLVIQWYKRLVKDGERPPINVDDIGLGGGVTDNLVKSGYAVNGLNVGETPDTYVEHEELYLNKRAQYYWQLRELFMQQKIVLEDDMLEFELSKISLDYTKGRIKVEEKDKIRRKLGGSSPDAADCCMLTFAESEEEGTGSLIFLI